MKVLQNLRPTIELNDGGVCRRTTAVPRFLAAEAAAEAAAATTPPWEGPCVSAQVAVEHFLRSAAPAVASAVTRLRCRAPVASPLATAAEDRSAARERNAVAGQGAAGSERGVALREVHVPPSDRSRTTFTKRQ